MLYHGSVGWFQNKECFFMFTFTFFGIFVVVFHKKFFFVIIVSFFDEVSNFRIRILLIRNRNWWWEIFSGTACRKVIARCVILKSTAKSLATAREFYRLKEWARNPYFPSKVIINTKIGLIAIWKNAQLLIALSLWMLYLLL